MNKLLDANNIREKFRRDPVGSYNDLVLFIERYSQNQRYQELAVLLGSEIFDDMEEQKLLDLSDDGKMAITNKAIQIIDSIVSDEYEIPPAQSERFARVREYFRNTQVRTTVFNAESVTKKFHNFCLEKISFKLNLGEITGVIGENGHGKSTLLKIVSSDVAPSEGVCNYPLFQTGKNQWRKIKQQIATVPQRIPPLKNNHTIKQHLHFSAAVKGIKGEANNNIVNFYLSRLGLQKYADSFWNDLSGGFQLRVEIARQLVWNPKLLVLDEPLSNLDIKSQTLLLSDLRSLANSIKNPMSVILSSQNIYDIEAIADQVIFVQNGSVIYNGEVDAISALNGYNCFQVQIDCNLLEFHSMLWEIKQDIYTIKEHFSYFLIYANVNINSEKILSIILNKNFQIINFRDVSNSTRPFFENAKVIKENNSKGV